MCPELLAAGARQNLRAGCRDAGDEHAHHEQLTKAMTCSQAGQVGRSVPELRTDQGVQAGGRTPAALGTARTDDADLAYSTP